MRRPLTLLAGALALALAPPVAAQVLFVDRDATGAGDGSSWSDAFGTLGPALAAAAPGSQVWVAEGLYLPAAPDDPDPREATFALPAEVELYGGFAGTESALAERDPQAHPTVLSGDLGVRGDPSDNAYHVLTAGSGTGRLDGFTVRDGRADGPDSIDKQGALLLSNTSSLVVAGCRFTGGLALEDGGAVRASNAHETFVACEFVGNLANAGGAVSLVMPQGVVFEGCLFQDNGGVGTAARGGAIRTSALFGDTDLRVSDSTFLGNSAVQGGALDLNPGAGSEDVLVERCRFEGNGATHGGALAATGLSALRLVDSSFVGNEVTNLGGAVALFQCDAQIARCRFVGNNTPFLGGAVAATSNTLLGNGSAPRITDSLFVGNAAERGGAVFATGGQGVPLALVGCTLAANTASDAGGGVCSEDLEASFGTCTPLLHVRNSILWGNSDLGGADESAQLDLSGGGTLFLDRSIVQGLTGALGGTGNLGLDPLFVDLDGADGVLGTLDDHARLAPGSPAIDAGDGGLLLADTVDADCDGDLAEPQPLDLDGLVRAVDDPATPDTGAGGAPVVDMGAHEFGSALPVDVWTDLGGGTPGAAGVPQLALSGTLCAGQLAAAQLASAAPGRPAMLWIAVGSTPLSVWGGTLHAFPFAAKVMLVTDGAGAVSGSTTWPAGVPAGLEFVFQFLVSDPASPFPFVLSNAVLGTTP